MVCCEACWRENDDGRGHSVQWIQCDLGSNWFHAVCVTVGLNGDSDFGCIFLNFWSFSVIETVHSGLS